MRSKSERSLEKPGMRFSSDISEHSKTIGENLVRLNFLIDRIDFHDKTVLFSGCGTGYEVNHLAEQTHCRKITGIDISSKAIDHAIRNNRYDNIEYRCQDALSPVFPQGSFDVVISLEVLEHLENQRDYLSEQARILKKGGLLLLSTPNRMVFSAGFARSRNKTHINELNLPELKKLLVMYFKEVEIFGQRLRDPNTAKEHLEGVRNYHKHRRYFDTKNTFINLLRWLKLPVLIFRLLRKPGPEEGYDMDQYVIDKEAMDWAIWNIAICRR